MKNAMWQKEEEEERQYYNNEIERKWQVMTQSQ